MKISALVDIVEGKLLNSPAISFVTQIHTNIKKVNDGDAFFAFDESTIKKAIEKGTFCIIVDFIPQINDNEIAWIKVDDISKAITNVLRYKLLSNNIEYFFVDKVLFEFLKLFKTKDMVDTLLLTNNIIKDFETLYNTDSNKKIYSTNIKMLKNITPNIQTIKYQQYNIKNLTNHSLFETSFSYKNLFYDKLKLPYVYINHFLQLKNILKDDIDIKRLNNNILFKPIFINKSNQIVNFGQTNRFILASIDEEIANIEISYLKAYYNYANIKIIEAVHLTDQELFTQIEDIKYNAIFIKGKDISFITQILEQNDNTDKLF